MDDKFYFAVIDECGDLVEKFDEKCNFVDFGETGLFFKRNIDGNLMETLGFFTYGSIAGFKRFQKKGTVSFDD